MAENKLKQYNKLVDTIQKRYIVWKVIKKEDKEFDKKIINSVLKEYRFLIKTIEDSNER